MTKTMNEKFEFVVGKPGRQQIVVIEAKDRGEAILKLEDRFGGLALGDYYLNRRTFDGQTRCLVS